ncbi:MAG: hypothetical protein IJG33_14970 [Selenomonadaceae bacterium]|nr:hypothetical protein [Selenomonadaceae bacterium]
MFFTYANAKYQVFATLYPLFALISNPYAVVEIIISDYELFKKNYANIMEFYDTNYPGKVRYTSVDANPLIAGKNILPNSMRFIIEPTLKAKYVYIGDIDILLAEDVLNYWLKFMDKHQSDFGNVVRPNNPDAITGLHFIPYDKMYPVVIPPDIDLRMNDEMLLCRFMREKKLRFPVNASLWDRRVHGVHISYFSRPPLDSKTTFDRCNEYFPAWGREYAEKYLDIRYSKPVIKFIECIRTRQIELRRIIQFTDMWAFFCREHPGNAIYDRNAAPDKVVSSKQEQPTKVLSKPKKNLDFLLNWDYHTACDRQDILSRF